MKQNVVNFPLPRRVCDNSPQSPFRGLLYVFANKIDIDRSEWQVSAEEGRMFCASIGAVFCPLSARTGEGGGKAEPLTDPFMTTCGHTFDVECYMLSRNQSTQCPICRKILNDVGRVATRGKRVSHHA